MDFFDVVIIGAGPGGYVGAIKAAQLGFKTALVEKDSFLGGTCLNVGCIPSKSLLQSSEHYAQAKNSFSEHGIHFKDLSFDFDQMQKRKGNVVQTFRSGLNGLMKKNGVHVFNGEASFENSTILNIGSDKKISFRYAVIATGSVPMSLPNITIDEEGILSSTGALALKEVPKRLGIVGAGVIGVEIGSVYCRLGSLVTMIEFLPKITPTCDEEISKEFQKILEAQGLKFHLSSKVLKVEKIDHEYEVSYEKDSSTIQERFDKVLICVGRKPFTEGLSLDKAGVNLDAKGFIPVNNSYQTNVENIYAIGDVIGQPMLAHKASDEAIAVVSHLAGQIVKLNIIAIPNVIYTDPEVASCGLTEQEAKDMNLAYKVAKFPFKANSRAKAAMMDHGFVKLLVSNDGYLLGAHIIGAHAGELIEPLILLMDQKLPIKAYEHVPHAHPTLIEAVKEAALAAISKSIHY